MHCMACILAGLNADGAGIATAVGTDDGGASGIVGPPTGMTAVGAPGTVTPAAVVTAGPMSGPLASAVLTSVGQFGAGADAWRTAESGLAAGVIGLLAAGLLAATAVPV